MNDVDVLAQVHVSLEIASQKTLDNTMNKIDDNLSDRFTTEQRAKDINEKLQMISSCSILSHYAETKNASH